MAIFYGIAVIWERDLGILHMMLVSPASRAALVFGKGLSAACARWCRRSCSTVWRWRWA